jgi:hypothetical protein
MPFQARSVSKLLALSWNKSIECAQLNWARPILFLDEVPEVLSDTSAIPA